MKTRAKLQRRLPSASRSPGDPAAHGFPLARYHRFQPNGFHPEYSLTKNFQKGRGQAQKSRFWRSHLEF